MAYRPQINYNCPSPKMAWILIIFDQLLIIFVAFVSLDLNYLNDHEMPVTNQLPHKDYIYFPPEVPPELQCLVLQLGEKREWKKGVMRHLILGEQMPSSCHTTNGGTCIFPYIRGMYPSASLWPLTLPPPLLRWSDRDYL